MVQRYGEYTYRQGWMRGIVGGERRGKEMDRCPLTESLCSNEINFGFWLSNEFGTTCVTVLSHK
jgi:hypothetical protein